MAKHRIDPTVGTPFTKERQPSPAAKSAGWAKRKRGMELAKAVLNLAFKGKKDSQVKKEASEYFGIPQKDITVEMMLLFRQAEKAIQKGDTQAFRAVMERAFGLPKQDIDMNVTTPQIIVNTTEETKKLIDKL